MKLLTSLHFALAGALLPLALAGAPADRLPRKKFIELGWDIPNTAFLRDHWREMEQTTPFDGVMFALEAQDDQGKSISSQAVWSKRPWRRQWLEPALRDLKSCRFTNFTDNFVRFNATPGDLDWADDTGWEALAEKAGHCAWLMSQSGGKGLAVDFESYGANQFRFNPALGRSFADTATLARQRGRQWVKAVALEHPSAVILALWLNSLNTKAGASEPPEGLLAGEGYGLLPAFVDGMLAAAPPTMILVDGCENGYYMDSAEEYLRAAHEMRSWNGSAVRLVSPENRAKYRQQVQAGFGFYLDMFINPEGHRYYRGPLDGSRLARLERNLGFALQAADEYVWVYGEQCRWWNGLGGKAKAAAKGRLWEEALPGVTRVIAYTRDPLTAARAELDRLRTAGLLTNLARNASFDKPARTKEPALPAEFSSWQHEPLGTFAWDGSIGGGAARASKVKWGCFLQAHVVRPLERYAVEVDCLPRGSTQPALVVRWQKADSSWVRWDEDRTFVFQPTAGEWRKAFGVVTVPKEAGKLVILLDANAQLTDQDACWFDNLGLYKLR